MARGSETAKVLGGNDSNGVFSMVFQGARRLHFHVYHVHTGEILKYGPFSYLQQ